jgi:hypothetical protein
VRAMAANAKDRSGCIGDEGNETYGEALRASNNAGGGGSFVADDASVSGCVGGERRRLCCHNL